MSTYLWSDPKTLDTLTLAMLSFGPEFNRAEFTQLQIDSVMIVVANVVVAQSGVSFVDAAKFVDVEKLVVVQPMVCVKQLATYSVWPWHA